MIEYRRADCGHFIDSGHPPAGVSADPHHQPVYLCDECTERARRHAPRVETKKVVEPDQTTVTLKYRAESSAEDFRPSAEGVQAALDGKTEDDCPYPDKRTKDAKEWLRGFREAKGNG